MMLNTEQAQLIALLASRGIASSRELQLSLGKSQPTVSRLLTSLRHEVVALGSARATRYGVAKSIRGLQAQQPVWWTDAQGQRQPLGQLSLLAQDIVHVEGRFGQLTLRHALPWWMAPLKPQGFLGRLLAQRLTVQGIDPNPDRWDLDMVLFAALQLHDAPGAVTLGDAGPAQPQALLPQGDALPAALDALAEDVAGTLPAGLSAGGEQPKFLALLQDGQPVLVKFSPPHGTPFGDRWSDLLQAEQLASAVLTDHGVPCAGTRLVRSARRTYLLSERFDRVGRHGRRHVVAVGEVHAALVPGPYAHWAATCAALARQRRLSPLDAERAAALLHFGRLIGNTDMHGGNLSLAVSCEALARGRFTLAPVYDMLPMRWRPDPVLGGAPEYSSFEPDAASLRTGAAVPAQAFWRGLAQQADVSRALRRTAAEMASRMR